MNHIYLKPGELYVGDPPAKVTTVLGSCLGITMCHPDSGLGAICHAIQPRCNKAAVCRDDCHDSLRYVACVVPRMVEIFRERRIHPHDIQVKLFGGAAIIGHQKNRGVHRSVGQMNVTAAMEIINSMNLKMKVANAGGNFGRKIIFNTRTGIVWMKRIKNTTMASDTLQENKFCSAEELISGDLEGECW